MRGKKMHKYIVKAEVKTDRLIDYEFRLSDEKFKKLMDAYDDLLKALDKQVNEFRKKELVK